MKLALLNRIDCWLTRLEDRYLYQPGVLDWKNKLAYLFGRTTVERKWVVINCPYCRKAWKFRRDELSNLQGNCDNTENCAICDDQIGNKYLGCCANSKFCGGCLVKMNTLTVDNTMELNRCDPIPVELYLQAEAQLKDKRRISIRITDTEKWYVKKRGKRLIFYYDFMSKKDKIKKKLKKFTRDKTFEEF